MSTSTNLKYIEAAYTLGALIAENPVLLQEVSVLVGPGFRGLSLPRGVRVRANSLIARIRRGPEAPAGPNRRREDRVFEPAPADATPAVPATTVAAPEAGTPAPEKAAA